MIATAARAHSPRTSALFHEYLRKLFSRPSSRHCNWKKDTLRKLILQRLARMLQSRSNLYAALALALIACLFTTAAHGQGVQNIDASQPILRTSPLNNQADGYFGYQVVLHQTAAAVGDRDTALEMAKSVLSYEFLSLDCGASDISTYNYARLLSAVKQLLCVSVCECV